MNFVPTRRDILICFESDVPATSRLFRKWRARHFSPQRTSLVTDELNGELAGQLCSESARFMGGI